jgi:hypothetical protein
MSRSNEPFYDEKGSELWAFFRRLFGLMHTGGSLHQIKLPEIDGGLFEPDPLMDSLIIPTSSASASTVAGISRPSDFAVFRLMNQLELNR